MPVVTPADPADQAGPADQAAPEPVGETRIDAVSETKADAAPTPRLDPASPSPSDSAATPPAALAVRPTVRPATSAARAASAASSANAASTASTAEMGRPAAGAASPPPRPSTDRDRPPAKAAPAAPNPGAVATGGLGSVSPGDEIAGYRLEEQIGTGGMAVVYRAHDERLDRRVALKLLASGLAADEGFRQRFIRESRAAAAVDHPHIIPIYEAGDAGGALFIAMRYVQGGDVRSLLARNGPLPAARAWSIINQVGAALDAAHAYGLIHRDVKPANMLLDARARVPAAARGLSPVSQPEHVYLSDFGISKLSLSTSHLTSTGQFVGTLDYIAPEQITGRDVDGRADLYSLGCAAFELLSGKPPFRRDEGFALISAHLTEPPPPLTTKRDDLPEAVDLVLAGAMAKVPGKRYETCERFTTDLGRALGLIPGYLELPGSPRPISLAGQPDAPPSDDVLGTPLAIPTALGAYGTSVRQAGRSPQPAEAAPRPAATPEPQPQRAVGSDTWPGGPAEISALYPVVSNPAVPPGRGAGPPPPPARMSRGMLALVALCVAIVAGAATAAVILLSHHHASGSPLSSQSGPVSSAPASPAPSTHQAATSPPASTSSASTSPTASSPAPAPSSSAGTSVAGTQASAVSSLLATGANSSVQLTDAVDNVQACTDVPSNLSSIQAVRDQRQTEYNQAQALDTGALANGAALKSSLTTALSYSLKADDEYLQWAQQQAASCHPGSQSSAAAADGQQALTYKTTFVGLWNPVAVKYGLPTTTTAKV